VAKDGGDFVSSQAPHIHEVGVGALHQALLVLSLLFQGWGQEVLHEGHVPVGEVITTRK